VLGYAFFVYEAQGRDWRSVVANGADAARRRDVEALLLKHSIETLQQSPGIHRAEAQLLLHPSGRLARHSWRAVPHAIPGCSSVANLGEVPVVATPIHSEIEIRPWTEQDYQPTAGLITACYRDHVDSEINDQYRSVNGSLRFLHNIVRFPGCGQFDPASSFVAYKPRLDMIVGVILCSRIRHDAGHVTQVCVLPEYRSHGIGDALMPPGRAGVRGHGVRLLTD